MTAETFLVGAAQVEITPELGVGLLMSALERQWVPFEGVRRPLQARLVVIEAGGDRVALAALDLLGLATPAFGADFKARVVAAAGGGLAPDHLLLTATHTHAAPESLAITDLYQTPAFQRWLAHLVGQLGWALRQALRERRPCRLAVGQTTVAGLTLNRRIMTTTGMMLSHPPPPPETILSPPGPVDERVAVAAFMAGPAEPLALLVNAACHPVHEMCLPYLSPDFPGEMCHALSRTHPATPVLFFNGAAGNLNPPTVSTGPTTAEAHGRRLAEAVEGLLPRLSPQAGAVVRLARQTVEVPGRLPGGAAAEQPLRLELAALRLNQTALLFVPGELFVELGLAIQQRSPAALTMVVGYAEDWLGYFPPDAAFAEGGYELGPGPWARVGPGSAARLEQAALSLLAALGET